MVPILALSLVLAVERLALAKAEAELSEDIRTVELKAHVYRLASPEFQGRRGAGAARAARHIAGAFAALQLKPAFGDSYDQPIPWLLSTGKDKETSFIGKNVAAILPGSDPKLKDEWILLTAHFDHLGAHGTKIYCGADDNASGCAMLLEIAERFALQEAPPKRTIVLVAFDQEESGLMGSTHFAAHPPLPFKQLKAFITADMVGRSMGNVMDEYVFALGTENSKGMRRLLEETRPGDGLKVGRVGADVIGTRSDYGPFRDRNIPFLFVSTGVHPDYHTARDTADRVDYEKMRKISDWVYDLTARLADAAVAPRWDKDGLPPDIDEVRTIHLLLSRVLNKPEAFALTEKQAVLARSTRDKLGAILARGTVTPTERSALLWTARLLMAMLF